MLNTNNLELILIQNFQKNVTKEIQRWKSKQSRRNNSYFVQKGKALMVDVSDGNVQLGEIGSPEIKIKGNIEHNAQLDNKSSVCNQLT